MIRTTLCALVGCTALAQPVPAQEPLAENGHRILTGKIGFSDGSALPEDALLLIEARDMSGRLVGAQQVRADRSKPLIYAFEVPGGAELRVRAAILDGLRTIQISGGRPIPADATGRVDVRLALDPVTPAGFPFRMRCSDQEVEIETRADGARMKVGHGWHDLVQVPAASGAKFAATDDPQTYFWNKGRSARISLRGEVLPECGPAITPDRGQITALNRKPLSGVSVIGSMIAIYRPVPPMEVIVPLPPPETIPGGVRYTLPDMGVGVNITARMCRDSKNGVPYPYRVVWSQAATGMQPAMGAEVCAGDPRSLLTGTWTITSDPGITTHRIEPRWLTITPYGQITGSAHCNLFSGALTVDAQQVSISVQLTTKRACPERVLANEKSFLTLLQMVDRLDLTEDGTLELSRGRRMIRAQ